ncbi:MAG: GAF domain-containing protein [Tenuifilaceae bacterium]
MKLKHRLSLQQKILVMVIGASVIIYAIALGFISVKSRNSALVQAITITNTYANKYASEIKYLLEEDLYTVRTLSQSVLSYRKMPEKQWKDIFARMYEEVITGNPHFLSVWDSWELKNLDPSYTKDHGRYVCEFWREKGTIKSNTSFKSLTGDELEYARIKKDKIESLENPYFYSYTGNDKDQLLMTSLIVPIMENGNYIGVIGVDISLSQYYPIINQIRPYKDSHAFLIANDLHYIAHTDQTKIGANSLDDYENLFTRNSIVEKITGGEPTNFYDIDLNGTKSYFTFIPVIVGKTKRPWSLVVVVPKSSILSEANRNFVFSIVVGVLGLLLLSSVIFFSSTNYIITPITKITQTLKRLALGDIDNDMILEYDQSDEIGQMAEALNVSVKGLTQKTEFSQNIGKGKLDASFELLSEKDSLGKSLIQMRESLKTAKEEDHKRKVEDQKRQWTNEGLAKFSDILRQNNDKIELLASEVIKNLVHYLNANQGGLFIYNDDDPDFIHFELLSAFAYNRHKHIQKQIMLGEGLVGTCALEKQTIYLTEIPENYIQITSGLGEARPRCLLIVPLLIEEKVLGIIEIASFTEIETYQIEFVEKLAQSIASTLTSVRTNTRTALLLTKTQQQAEEMSAQEEEMRQNMEELQATQEESARKTSEMQSYIDALNNSTFVTEYDSLGYVISVNNDYLELIGLTRDQVVGTHHSYKLDLSKEKQDEYDKFWNDLRNGIVRKEINKFVLDDKEIVLRETYTPIKSDQGQVYKILKIAANITDIG